MSHLPSSQMQRQRNARKPVVTSPRQAPPPKRLNQRDLDSSCHRLSRVPQKFANNKAIQNEKSESFAVNYFKKNPDAKDSTPPDQKLQEIEEKLKSEDLDTSERFKLLVRQKALRYILYGENSVEALRSHAAIGFFYNENHRSSSAIRHLNKARQLEESLQQNDIYIDREESLQIAVETAEAYINIRTAKSSESTKNFNNAEKVLSPWAVEDVENPMLKYRRDLSLARILFNKGQVDDCIKKYEEAWQSLDQANNGEEKVETAVLFYELARVYEYVEKRKKAGDYFQKAYNIYKSLDMEEEAQMVEEYLPTGDEVDQEDEEDKNEEEGENGEDKNDEEGDNEIERNVESRSSSQNIQKSDKDDDKNSEHSEKNEDSDHSSQKSEHSDTEKKSSEEEENENHSSNHSSRSSNRDDSDKDKSQSDEQGKAEQLLGGFGNALLGDKKDSNDEKTDDGDEKNDDGTSSENKLNSTSGFDNSESNNDKSETEKSETGGFDDSEAQKTSSEKPKLSDTGGFDDDE